MNNKRKPTVASRLTSLIAEAGGNAPFCRKVWPKEKDSVGANKSKVSKWAHGPGGISPDEAEIVALAFQRRPAWLLFGEEPERSGVSRTLADLASDLRAEVLTRVFADGDWIEGNRAYYERYVDADALLRNVCAAAASECAALEKWMQQTRALDELQRLLAFETSTTSNAKTNIGATAEKIEAALKNVRALYSAAPQGALVRIDFDRNLPPGVEPFATVYARALANQRKAPTSPRTKRRK
jgi:hypothetical protein